MDTKLTLKLNKNIIEKAKVYAKKNDTSLSKIIEDYFAYISNEQKDEKTYTPLVNELSGILDFKVVQNYKEKYTDYLINKYL